MSARLLKSFCVVFAVAAITWISTSGLTTLAHASDLKRNELQAGDLLLISQPCYVCSLIEIEEDSPYSHGGILVQDARQQWWVLEAWTHVGPTRLESFLARKRKNTHVLHRKPILKSNISPARLNSLIWNRFKNLFSYSQYDPSFLWNNRDQMGNEKVYCSELIVKLLQPFLARPILTQPMHFVRYRNEWIQYFKNTETRTPPDGKPGVSPGDLARSHSFKTHN